MAELPTVEAELVKVTKFKGKYDDRQDYLAALLHAIDSKLSNDDYDNLSDEAVKWHHAAVKSHEAQEEIPDFEGEAETVDALPLTDTRHPIQKNANRSEDEVLPSSDEDDEAEDTPDTPENDASEEVVKPKPVKKVVHPVGSSKRPDYTKITGEKDKWGVIKGTLTARALEMYEQGCTAKQLLDELGGRHYNVLKKMVKEGHKLEKSELGVWKLTHKDSLPPKKEK